MFQSFFNGLKSVVLEIFKYVWAIFFDEDSGLVWWVFDIFLSFGESFILKVVEVLGMNDLLSQYSGVIAEVYLMCSKLNQFVPFAESMELLGIFLAFLVVFIMVKVVLKFIPFIG